ncbi:MAG: N-acetyltransferase [Phycisphaerales bacterium]
MGNVPPTSFTLRNGVPCVVRSAVADDTPRLMTFVPETFATTDMVLTQADEWKLTEAQERAFVQECLDTPGSLAIVAEVATSMTSGHGFAGMLTMKQGHRRRSEHTTYLGMMVGEAWRGKGVGDALMQCAVAFGKATPVLRRITLEVAASNPAGLALYKKHGFVIEGTRKGQFQRVPGVFEDDYCMACDVS